MLVLLAGAAAAVAATLSTDRFLGPGGDGARLPPDGGVTMEQLGGGADRRTALEPAGSARSTVASPVRPSLIRIPRLALEALVLPISMEASVLTPPEDPQVLGWWAGGAVPGAERGTALITGHAVHNGGGALDDLESLRRGDAIAVAGRSHTVRFRVTLVQVMDKAVLAQRAQRLFSQTIPGRLALVTCEKWNGSTYDANVVVLARQVS